MRGIHTHDVRIPRGTRMRKHGHDDGLVCAVLSGECLETVGGNPIPFRPGDVRISGPGVEHDLAVESNARFLLLEIPSELWREIIPPPQLPAGSIFTPSAQIHDLVTDLCRHLGPPTAVEDVIVEDQLREIVCRSLRLEGTPSFGPPPNWLRALHDRLRDERAEIPGLSVLAEQTGIHRSHLARAFRAHYGETIGAFVRRRRLAYARSLLEGPKHTIAEVAAEAGFADQAHLTREFRRRWKTTPAAFRRNFRSRPDRRERTHCD